MLKFEFEIIGVKVGSASMTIGMLGLKVAPKEGNSTFTEKCLIKKLLPKSPNIWATFVRKFVVKIFQQEPNLVTMVGAWIRDCLLIFWHDLGT